MPLFPKHTVDVLAVLAVVLATTACRREPRNQNPDTPPPPVSAPAESASAPSTTSTTDHVEVFRRAFWRHPTPADEILNAERRVHPDDSSWSWFIQLHPSPELLAALRDPEAFALRPPGAPSPSSAPPLPSSPPTWFPISPATADFEILQSPSTALTVLYRASDNLLFATDHGTAFSPPAR